MHFRRFLRGAALVFALALLLTTGAVLAGQAAAAPNPVGALGFARCERRTCFRDLLPGRSAMDEVPSGFPGAAEAAEPVWLMPGMAEDPSGMEPPESLDVTGPQGIVAVLRIMPLENQSLPPLGDFIALFGEPCGITMVSGTANFRLVFPDMLLTVDSGEARPDPYTAPAAAALIYAPAMVGAAELCGPLAVYPWRGFTPMGLD